MRAIAQRYASALVDVAIERGTAERTKKELGDFLQLLQESADLRNFLASPSVPRAGKHEVIGKLVTRLGASETLRNFLFVITDNRRTQLVPEIYQEFVSRLHDRLGIAEAQVRSAQELSEEEKTNLRKTLEHLTGKKVEAQYRLDPNLIGGAVVRIGSTVYDGSVREQLERMRQKLAGE